MAHSHTDLVVPPRPLSDWERDLLQYLLAANFLGKDALRKQAEEIRVSGRCTCGCLTIIFDVNRSHNPQAAVQRRIPIEAEAPDRDGVKIHVLLHVIDGWLNELEVFREDSKPLIALPEVKRLQLVLF